MLRPGVSVLGAVVSISDTYAMQPPVKYKKMRNMRRAWAQAPCLMAPPGWSASASVARFFWCSFVSAGDTGITVVADAGGCRSLRPWVAMLGVLGIWTVEAEGRRYQDIRRGSTWAGARAQYAWGSGRRSCGGAGECEGMQAYNRLEG